MTHWSDELVAKYSPCAEAVELMRTFKTSATAWRNCKRGDWMLWLLGTMSGPSESASRRKLVLAACACARLSLKYVPASETRPRVAIETAEAWAKGKEGVTLEKVKSAAYASASASAAYASASAYAAYASAAASAAYASAAASASASAAASAAYAYASASASASAAYAAARTKTLSACADIVRKFYPKAPTTMEETKP